MAEKHSAGVNTGPEQKAKDRAMEREVDAFLDRIIDQEKADKQKSANIARGGR